ncbi:NEW3 domain-containing protein [Halobaculum rubrum]|uniref:NEW3 domain-containing protein n=1 Tax=Halobaculum rubrum TaxID=2872158 RepID=UPI001CA40309|nr:NEW3 domain-containing protein [Halobaculum rubrum]QZX99118.1 DUF11 domain-containing protein [Halobaculum rubrum]
MRDRDPPHGGSTRWLYAAIVALTVVAVATTGPVAAQSDGGLGLSLDPVRDTVEPGETVQIGVTVENAGDDVAPGTVLALDPLPDGWVLESWSGTDAAFRNSTNEWLWTTVDSGETLKFTVVVGVPSDAAGDGTVSGTLTDGTDRQTSASTTIRVNAGTATATPSGPASTSTAAGDGGDGDDDVQRRIRTLRTAVETPGFGPIHAALGVLLAAAMVAIRRDRR